MITNINKNTNFTKLYDEQVSGKITGTDEYAEYTKYLTFFFQEAHNKRDKYNREFLNGKYILISKDNPSKKIEITPAKFISIHRFYVELKNQINKILLKFYSFIDAKDNFTSENREEFDNLKQKYVTYKRTLDEIDLINNSFYKEIDELNMKKLEKMNDLIIRYKKKTVIYGKIKTMIKQFLKNEMIKMFSENKMSIPSDGVIKNLAKTNDIPSDDIELWFEWIEENYYYLLLRKDISEISEQITKAELSYNINTDYFIVKKPEIKQINK